MVERDRRRPMDMQFIATEFEEGWLDLSVRWTGTDGDPIEIYMTTVALRDLCELVAFFEGAVTTTNSVDHREFVVETP